MTLTRLTGALAESILSGCEIRRESVVRCTEELGWASEMELSLAMREGRCEPWAILQSALARRAGVWR